MVNGFLLENKSTATTPRNIPVSAHHVLVPSKILTIHFGAQKRIDWTSHAQAIRNFQTTSNIFMVKFLSKWLPVGKQIHRYNPAAYSSQCPSCSCAIEDFDHAFRCPDPNRRRWRSDLTQALLRLTDRSNTDPAYVDLLINGLYRWFQDTPSAPVSRFPRYGTVVEHQSSIGWDQLIFSGPLFGQPTNRRTSNEKSILPPTNHGTGWTSRTITLIWTHCHKAWLDRNQALTATISKPNILPDGAQFRIRSLYDLRNQFSQFVWNLWVYPSLEDHFSRVPDQPYSTTG
jgi:hypothetical protein